MATKWVYLFKEGSADMKNLLGGKGANLAEMTIIPAARRLLMRFRYRFLTL